MEIGLAKQSIFSRALESLIHSLLHSVNLHPVHVVFQVLEIQL